MDEEGEKWYTWETEYERTWLVSYKFYEFLVEYALNQFLPLLVLAHYSSFALFLYSHSLSCFYRAAFILATWLVDFTLVYTTGVVQNSYKKRNVHTLISTHACTFVSGKPYRRMRRGICRLQPMRMPTKPRGESKVKPVCLWDQG